MWEEFEVQIEVDSDTNRQSIKLDLITKALQTKAKRIKYNNRSQVGLMKL